MTLAERLEAFVICVVLFACGLFGSYVLELIVPDWLPRMLGTMDEMRRRLGLTWPILALFALYLVVVSVWLVAECLGARPVPFDVRRHLHYVEGMAPLLGLLATTLAMGQAMQGFDPAAGMRSTSTFLVQHAGHAMWATATGIGEAYVARTILWLFALDNEEPRS